MITELVLNHTSDQHPWFQRARRAKPGSAARNFYVWSDTPEKYQGARIIFQDFEHSNWTWDHEAKAYYWHRFYSHQPDLNWDNPQVRKTMLQVMDFWFDDVGVDGLRLDAVPYLFEREGTNNENLPETHAALKEIRALRRRALSRTRCCSPRPTSGRRTPSPTSGRERATSATPPSTSRSCRGMFMGIQTEDRYPIVDMLEQTPPIPANCQWVLFLRNHDELTLEMVTDEERDYMYRVYAQDQQARINVGIRRRLAPLLGNSRRKIELMNALLLSLPGTPVLYYGDEIGMGDNFYLGDRNGVRTPMQWSPDRNAGFSRGELAEAVLAGDHRPRVPLRGGQRRGPAEQPPVAAVVDQAHPERAQAVQGLRPRHAWSSCTPTTTRCWPSSARYEGETVLVVANLSRFAQHVELNLGAFKGLTPVELFGRNALPRHLRRAVPAGPGPAQLLLVLPRAAAAGRARSRRPPSRSWSGAARSTISCWTRTATRWKRVLPAILRTRPWFRGRQRKVQWAEVVEQVPVAGRGLPHLRAAWSTPRASPRPTSCPWRCASGAQADDLAAQSPQALLARVHAEDGGAGRASSTTRSGSASSARRCSGSWCASRRGRRRASSTGWSAREIRRPRDPQPGPRRPA